MSDNNKHFQNDRIDKEGIVSRRAFISKGFGMAGSLSLMANVVGNPVLAKATSKSRLNLDSLQGKFKRPAFNSERPRL